MYKALLFGLLAVAPTSTNFTLDAYDFGNGAGAPSSSNYQLQASAGQAAGAGTSSTYALPSGVRASTTIDTPPAPTFTNPSNEYNRLRISLNVSVIPSDTKYLIAISDDDFVTTQYVQLDQTIGAGANIGNYQTYASWGGASGFWILGLEPGTPYKVKVAALQGSATGSAFGPTASAATASTSVTFAVTTSLTPTPPFIVDFSSLTLGSVASGSATLHASVTTNAINGGAILIKDQNAGLNSARASYTLASATADLSVAARGYGAQVSGVSQSSGGPLAATSPFNGVGNNVGALTSAWQQLASFATAITGGNVSTTLKAKSDVAVPSSTDYSDSITLSVSLLF